MLVTFIGTDIALLVTIQRKQYYPIQNRSQEYAIIHISQKGPFTYLWIHESQMGILQKGLLFYRQHTAKFDRSLFFSQSLTPKGMGMSTFVAGMAKCRPLYLNR